MSELNLKTLMIEYDLEIDDIRWYKSWITAQELLSYDKDIVELIQLIWSGRLADRLYDMEDRYAEELQDQMNRGILEETGVREILSEAYALKNKRQWNN